MRRQDDEACEDERTNCSTAQNNSLPDLRLQALLLLVIITYMQKLQPLKVFHFPAFVLREDLP